MDRIYLRQIEGPRMLASTAPQSNSWQSLNTVPLRGEPGPLRGLLYAVPWALMFWSGVAAILLRP